MKKTTKTKKIRTTKIKSTKNDTPYLAELLKKAFIGQSMAHAPYSKRFIGAAVLMEDGNIYSGCNIENASYGGTVCAERVAIWKAVSEGSFGKIKEILVVSSEKDPWPPCGMCRQVIAEFATKKTIIHTANPDGKMKSFTFDDIFPEAFVPDHLAK